MQAINRIQNAIINANAVIQGALVVDSANAHRAYPSFTPCDMTTTVSKCPGKPSRPTNMRSKERLGLALTERGGLTSGSVGRGWRHDSHNQTPATLWATLVLNRQLCG